MTTERDESKESKSPQQTEPGASKREGERPKDSEETTQNSGANIKPELVSSPSDLLDHLSRMVSSLEKVWSEALDSEPAVESREEAKDVWQSFVTVFVQWSERVGDVERRLGVEKPLDRFPLNEVGLSQLEVEPDDTAQQYSQLQVASLYAVERLMDSLEGLNNPTGKQMNFAPGKITVETWWEAGAFSIVRRRASALASILRKQEDLLGELAEGSEVAGDVPTGGVSSYSVSMHSLSAAADLVHRASHTAALPYLLLALRSTLAEAAEVCMEKLLTPLGTHMKTVPALTSLAKPVSVLEAVCERLGEGREIDAGVAVPLAEELGPIIRDLTYDPPNRSSLSVLLSSEERDG